MKTTSPFMVLSLLATILESQATNLALPYIQDEYGIPRATAQWVMTIFYLATASAAVPFGREGERFGYISALIFFSGVCAALYLSQYFISNFGLLLAFRFLSGLFSSGIMSSRNIMARFLPPPEESRKFMQQMVLCMNFTFLIAPLLAGVILDHMEWESFFLIDFAIMAMSTIILFFYTNNEKKT